MKPLYRPLLRIALAGTTMGFAAASYAREGMSPLDVLPTLVTPTPWLEAALPLGSVTVIGAICALVLSKRIRFFASDHWLINHTIATIAAIATYSYDLCRDIGLGWLPAFGGCHCWVTGAAAVCSAIVSGLVIFALGLVTVRVVQTIVNACAPYLKRRFYRLVVRRMRQHRVRLRSVVRVRLVAFRGPPSTA